jgi:hypothetical protein
VSLAPFLILTRWECISVLYVAYIKMATNEAPISYARTRATTILLRSSDAKYEASNGGYSYSLVTPLIANPDELITVELVNAALPNSFYNIETGRNSFGVTETVSGTTASRAVTVSPGNYDVNTLRVALLAALTGGQPTYSLTFNTVTGRYSFSVSGASAVSFDMSGPMRRSLGFSQTSHNFVGTPLTLQSDHVCDLSSNNHSLLVQASFLSSSFITSKDMRSTGIIAVIPINAQNFNFILFQPQEEFTVLVRNNLIDTFMLNVTNQDGRQIDFNGVEWEISLRFRFEKDPEFEQSFLNSLSLTRRLIRLQGEYLRQHMERSNHRQAARLQDVAQGKGRIRQKVQELEQAT